MNAAHILKAKGSGVVIVRPEVSLEEAAQIMTKRGIGCVLVAGDDIASAGILSERDIVREVALGGASRLKMPVGEAMTHPIHTCEPRDSVDHLMGVMTARRFRHVPVVENGEFIGLVSIGDVVKHKIAEAELETEAMRAYITSAG